MNKIDKNNSPKIFLTGGAGFIGRNILEGLGKKYNFVAPSAKELDLTNTEAVYNFLEKEKFDIIVHTASMGGVRREEESPDAISVNLRMFFNLARAKPFYKKLIMFGSGAEYDKRRPIVNVKETEFDRFVPIDQYGFYKYACSKYAEGTDFITHIRLFGVYGKYERYETRFISNAICRVLFDLPISINQNVFFDFIYIKDLVRIIDYFLEREPKHKFYNVGRGSRMDLATIAKKILQISGKDLLITIKKSGLNNEYTCDTSRLSSEFSGLRYTDFDQSIRELFEYYKFLMPKINKESLLIEK
ncbi:MAG: NAD-dependent epimerase/dehydratase family protein [Candidatus Staskawiczbacteria bacterium]|jgi:GDP-L-fucose synthase